MMIEGVEENTILPRWDVPVLYEDNDLVVVNKPSGLITIPDRHDDSLPSVQKILGSRMERIFTVHRIDRETSGVLLFAKTEDSHRYLSGLFEDRQVEKMYQGIVHGSPHALSGDIDAPIATHPANNGTMVIHRKGKPALTTYQVEESYGVYSLLRFQIHTGRTHQIRLHCKHIGHPIVCDSLYGDGKPFLLSTIKKKFKLAKQEETERAIVSRLALHAFSLRFTGKDGQSFAFEAPLHKDMRAMLQQLKKIRG
jgi:23S rRNA pseudouridine1911/1915/1917 synthase